MRLFASRNLIATRKMLPAVVVAILIAVVFPPVLAAQTTPGPDVLVLISGERLTGHLADSVDGKLDFTSDALGKLSIDWSKVQELHGTEVFAVIRKNVKLNRQTNVSTVPQGTISVAEQMITVTPSGGAPPQTIPLSDEADLVGQQVFLNAVEHNPSFLQGWTGTASLGAALVEATQSSTTVTSALNLVRPVPSQTWLEPRNRTTVDFNSAYGRLSQPATPTVKTSIYHADAERDEYFSGNIYALGTVAFDHNFSQGLGLQQIYGAGVGWTILKDAAQTLDVQGSLTYERQSFLVASLDHNLAGSVFSQRYNRKFSKGITLAEKISANPAWSQSRAYSANASLVLGFPLYKHVGLSASAADAFLNDPPPGFRQNSLQFATSVTYTFQ